MIKDEKIILIEKNMAFNSVYCVLSIEVNSIHNLKIRKVH